MCVLHVYSKNIRRKCGLFLCTVAAMGREFKVEKLSDEFASTF